MIYLSEISVWWSLCCREGVKPRVCMTPLWLALHDLDVFQGLLTLIVIFSPVLQFAGEGALQSFPCHYQALSRCNGYGEMESVMEGPS